MRPEVEEAIEIMMAFGKDGCKIMDSGGKDSTVLKYIAEQCKEKYGLDFSIHHNHTTLDAPETVYFIRRERERERANGIDFQIHYPAKTFEQLCMERNMLPTRLARFCCEELKESYGKRERVVTGVRKDESVNRKRNQGIVTIMKGTKNKDGMTAISGNDDYDVDEKGGIKLLNYDNAESVALVYTCFRTNKVLVNPILNWTEDDVWRCIRDNKLPINPLYECGWHRVGCVGCPMANYRGRMRDFARYPKYKNRYMMIAKRLVKKWHENNKSPRFNSAVEYFKWWIEDPNVAGQFSFDMDGNITEDYT